MEEARANAVLDKIRATLKSGDFKRQDQLIERLLEEGFSSTDIASALLHHLQGGESAPAAKAAREEAGRRREPMERRRPARGSRRRLGGQSNASAGAPRYERPAHTARRTTPPL